MFCLRSWLPLLFIPTNASPIFIFLFFVCTYFLNRPCVYCSFLLLILFASSCHWSDHCFFDFSSNWFEPRQPSSSIPHELVNSSALSNQTLDQVSMYAGALNNTAAALAGAALEEAKRRLAMRAEWTGIGWNGYGAFLAAGNGDCHAWMFISGFESPATRKRINLNDGDAYQALYKEGD